MTATEFKAKCLAILDEIAATGETVVVSKRGRPVVQLVPAMLDGLYPQDTLRGSVKIVGDVIVPTTSPDEWDAERGHLL